MIRRCKRKFEESIANKAKEHPKCFWSHIRSRLKTKEGVAPLLEDPKDKDSMKFTDEEKANILQRQFSSVFTNEPDGDVPTIPQRTNTRIWTVDVTVEMVVAEVCKMKSNKRSGLNLSRLLEGF